MAAWPTLAGDPKQVSLSMERKDHTPPKHPSHERQVAALFHSFQSSRKLISKVHSEFIHHGKAQERACAATQDIASNWLSSPFERLCIESWTAHPTLTVAWPHPERNNKQIYQQPTIAAKAKEPETSTEWFLLYWSHMDLGVQKCT